MAGIGFELRKMIEERRGLVAKVRAYACAGLISSGPWLMTILTLLLLSLVGPALGSNNGYRLFRALVTYAFAFSLIVTGIVQMSVTRRVADLLYSKQYSRVLPAFAAVLLATGLTHAVGAAVFVWIAGFPVAVSALVVALFSVTGMTWIALIWLSIARQYDEVLRAYIYGTLVTLLSVVLLLLGKGTAGILASYTAGMTLTLMLLVRTVMRGMETGGSRDLSIFSSLLAFPRLVAVGVFYNAAIWVDKMIFWFTDGIGPHPLVRYHPLYDTCSFLAYITVVPALAVNLVRLETSFYEKYRGYYGAILNGTPLGVIEDKRGRMLENLSESVIKLLRIQGFITAAFIVAAPLIIDFLELPPIAVRVFRLTCLGAFFHVLLLLTVLMQLYFDLRSQALATTAVFFGVNGILAWWSVNRGVETYGVGYALASFLSLLLGYMLLHRALERLDYMTFTNQPIAADEEKPDQDVVEREQDAVGEESEEEEESVVAPRAEPVFAVADEEEGGRLVIHMNKAEATEHEDDDAGKIIIRPDPPEEEDKPEKPDDAGKIVVHMDKPEPEVDQEEEDKRPDLPPEEEQDYGVIFPSGPVVPETADPPDTED